MGVQADYRDATVALLTACASNASVKLQVYRGRPRTILPPTAFIDSMADNTTEYPGSSTLYQHAPIVEVITVWGLFDSGEAVDQRDAFVDAFHDWVRANVHQVSGRSLIGPQTVSDIPLFVPDWLPEEQQVAYYATRITLEGFVTD